VTHELPDLLSPPAVFARAFQRVVDAISGTTRCLDCGRRVLPGFNAEPDGDGFVCLACPPERKLFTNRKHWR
jgi:hypothetical protein